MELVEALSLPDGTEEGFEDALRALLAFDKEWSLSDPDDEVLEEWANRGPAMVDE
jgi:hypothetical protein